MQTDTFQEFSLAKVFFSPFLIIILLTSPNVKSNQLGPKCEERSKGLMVQLYVFSFLRENKLSMRSNI